ncbi:hypothetical protein [Rhizobium sp. SYY.PMSO]
MPEKAAVAAYELIAKAYEGDVSVLNIELTLTDDGRRVGRFEISIRRID